jgi:tetratricopeptide (TPR) repeat protein
MNSEINVKRSAGHSRLFCAFTAVVLVYSFLAGLRTVTDYDLGWQLSTGRWIVQNHRIPSTDVFSYTAPGQPWIYPVASCLLLYFVFLIGGYSLLSWLGAAACVTTVALLLRRGSLASAMVAILALPRIAARTGPRAEMFTALLFAAFLSLLWEQFSTGRSRLWLLPILMMAWVNLHLGFIAGFALIATYIGCELLEMLFPGERRGLAVSRLKRSWPWLALTIPATLINPWGWNIYVALQRQNAAMAQHGQWINEWAEVSLNWNSWVTLISLRDTKGIFYLLLAVALVCVVLAALRRQPGTALIIVGAAYAGATHVRLQALFACVLIVVGGWILSTTWEVWSPRILDLRMRQIVTAGAAAVLVILAVARSADLVTNRHYLGGTETATFGTGLSWWFPERALAFINQQALPQHIFNYYNTGGFLIWRLGPRYQDYVDGRAIPFGPAIFEKQDRLMAISPDSAEWQREVDRYGINTVVLSLARYDGAAGSLPGFCNSKAWALIYLDEVSAVLRRRSPDTRQLLEQRALDCSTAPLLRDASSNPAIAFNQWANAALILHVLGRQEEALSSSDRALRVFPDSANLHFVRAKIFTAMRMPQPAEREYRIALALEPNDATWASLAQLYQQMGDPNRSFGAMQNAATISPRPHLMLVNLAFLYLEARQPAAALKALDEAEHRAPTQATTNGAFQLDLARGRASAWSALGNAQQAIAQEEAATRIAPDRSDLWRELATLYELNGRMDEAIQARNKAETLHAAERSETK